MQEALLMDELITKHTEIMDKYDPDNKVALVVDEWGGWYDVQPGTNPGFLYQQNTLRDAMIAGATLNIFNNHCKRVKMANLAQTVNVLQAVILTEGEKLILTPTYHVMDMYKVHQDALLLPVEVQNIGYQYESEELPAVSASASRDQEGRMHISLVNIDAQKAHTVNIDLQGSRFQQVTGTILTAENLQDHNTFDNPEKVTPAPFDDYTQQGNRLSVNLPPFSVIVLALN
jgi:alpha-N-arabinofuranosidase